MDDKAVIRKIKKLLTLSKDNGATESEAQRAMEYAQRLMTKYKISVASIDTTENQKPSVNHEAVFQRNSANVNPADEFIMQIISQFYGVRALYNNCRHSIEIILVGTPEDIEIAKYIHAYLRNIFFKCWNEYKKQNTKANKRSYYFGIFKGLSEKMQTAQDEEKAKASKKRQEKFEIVLVNTKEAISNYISDTFGRVHNSQRRRAKVDENSYTAGRSKGSTISINKAISA